MAVVVLPAAVVQDVGAAAFSLLIGCISYVTAAELLSMWRFSRTTGHILKVHACLFRDAQRSS